MAESIKPALTPDEWRLCLLRKAGKMIASYQRTAEKALDLPDEEYHAAASLLLEGQPFGFTWEMVDEIRSRIATDEYEFSDSFSDAVLRRAARCIEALLPPRETT